MRTSIALTVSIYSYTPVYVLVCFPPNMCLLHSLLTVGRFQQGMIHSHSKQGHFQQGSRASALLQEKSCVSATRFHLACHAWVLLPLYNMGSCRLHSSFTCFVAGVLQHVIPWKEGCTLWWRLGWKLCRLRWRLSPAAVHWRGGVPPNTQVFLYVPTNYTAHM